MHGVLPLLGNVGCGYSTPKDVWIHIEMACATGTVPSTHRYTEPSPHKQLDHEAPRGHFLL